jgi:CHAD domain-containing protein
MPGENPILWHWQTELQIFHQNLLLLQNEMNTEAIHDLRVAIKKLRSYLKLYVVLHKKKDAEKLFAKTRELFSVLGKHRNIEMSKELLLSFVGKNKTLLNSLLLYLQLLQEQTAPYCRQALQQYDKGHLDELTGQLQQDLEKTGTEDVIAIVKSLIASSIENIKHNLKHFKDKSHLIRKHLKDIFYWSKIFDHDVFFTKSQLKTVDKILDHLGDLQDHQVLITNLKSFRKTILSDGAVEYDSIKKTETKAKKKKDTILEKANKMTEELILLVK